MENVEKKEIKFIEKENEENRFIILITKRQNKYYVDNKELEGDLIDSLKEILKIEKNYDFKDSNNYKFRSLDSIFKNDEVYLKKNNNIQINCDHGSVGANYIENVFINNIFSENSFFILNAKKGKRN